METLGSFLVLASIVLWIIGMFKPSKIIFWRKSPTKLRVTAYCAIIFIIGSIMIPSDQPVESIATEDNNLAQEGIVNETDKEDDGSTNNETSKAVEEKQDNESNNDTNANTVAPISNSPSKTSKNTSTNEAKNIETKSETKTQSKPKNVPDNAIPAKVVRIVDGDTIKANVQGKEETIRMILVDTPETKHPSKPVEPFGPEASQFTTEMLEGKDVYLELDAQERDQYGRLLAYVWVGGKLFNKMLLEKGLARVAVYPPNVKYVDEFRAVQKQAQEKGIGIWSVENYAQEEKKQNTSKQTAKKTDTNKKTETKKESSSSKSTKQQAAPKNNARCADPKIKGNINSKGEKIYHVPGGAYYDRTIPEAWFCTEEEAKAAGFRPSKR